MARPASSRYEQEGLATRSPCRRAVVRTVPDAALVATMDPEGVVEAAPGFTSRYALGTAGTRTWLRRLYLVDGTQG